MGDSEADERRYGALDATKVSSRIGKTWTDGNGVTHVWTEASEAAHQEWLKRFDARLSEINQNPLATKPDHQ